jgi:hypothetical protein
MRKMIVTALVLGLVAGSLSAPAIAKKKKPRKPPVVLPVQTPVNFYLHNDSDPVDCTEPANFTLMLTEAESGGNCGNLLFGATYPVGEETGLASPFTYNAAEGLPFVLDGTQPIKATLYVSSGRGRAENPQPIGVGQTTVVAELLGSAGGAAKELGTAEATYQVIPGETTYEVKLEFPAIAELDKAVFDALSISLHQEGASMMHGYYRVADPASFITIPTWK